MNNTIPIAKQNISKIKEDSELLNTIISHNFQNSDEYWDKNGNFYLDRNLFPELNAIQYDGLRSAVQKGYVNDPELRNFIRNYFLFKSNLEKPENKPVYKPKYLAEPGKKQKQKIRRFIEALEKGKLNKSIKNMKWNYQNINKFKTKKNKYRFKKYNIKINNIDTLYNKKLNKTRRKILT